MLAERLDGHESRQHKQLGQPSFSVLDGFEPVGGKPSLPARVESRRSIPKGESVPGPTGPGRVSADLAPGRRGETERMKLEPDPSIRKV